MKTRLALVGAILLALGLAFLFVQTSTERRRLEAELAAARANADRVAAELDELKKRELSEAELARLKADQNDAIKLRGEVVNLKQSLTSSEKALASAQKSAASAQTKTPKAESSFTIEPLPENNPEALVHTTKLVSAQIHSGQGLVVGGWEGASGKRIFAIVQPTRIDPAGNVITDDRPATDAEQVTVTSKWIELSNEDAKKYGFSQFLDMSGEQTGIVDSIAVRDWLKTLEKAEGVDLLSPPSVTTRSGRQARVTVSDTKTTAAGPVEFGPKLDILPTVSDTGGIGVSMQASLVESPKKPAGE